MASAVFDDADRLLGQLPGAFFSSETAANCLGVSLDEARALLAGMQRSDGAVRVCREGWVLTVRHRGDQVPPFLTGYLDDMMKHLGVGYYLSYAGAASMRGTSYHGVLRTRANVETGDIDVLELREADGPADLGVRFHPIDPNHGRAASFLDSRSFVPTGGGHDQIEACRIRVATIETALFDMVEHPDRGASIDDISTIASKALWQGQLDPELLAETSDLYEPQVARRVGSMLQQLRGIQKRINLRPLWHRVRSRPIGPPIEIFSGKIDTARKADRWGITHSRRLDPDF